MVLLRWIQRKKQSKLEDLDMGLCLEYQVPVNNTWLNSRAGSNQPINLLVMTEGHGWQWLQSRTCTDATRRLVAAGFMKKKRQTHRKSPQQSNFFDYRVVWNCDFQLLPQLISKNSTILSPVESWRPSLAAWRDWLKLSLVPDHLFHEADALKYPSLKALLFLCVLITAFDFY